MAYTKTILKRNRVQESPTFQTFLIRNMPTNPCLPGLCCSFKWATFVWATSFTEIINSVRILQKTSKWFTYTMAKMFKDLSYIYGALEKKLLSSLSYWNKRQKISVSSMTLQFDSNQSVKRKLKMRDVSLTDLCIVSGLHANSRERKMREIFVIQNLITA
jgi:hypothetical protein